MSKQNRLKERQELLDMWNAIEPARNEDIARRAIDKAQEYLDIAERQAEYIIANMPSFVIAWRELPKPYKGDREVR